MPSRTEFRAQEPNGPRSGKLAMFRITGGTCDAFTFEEVLIMAAMNAESVRLSFESRVSSAETRCARHFSRAIVRKPML